MPQDNQKDLMKIIKKQDSTQDQSSQPQVTPSGRKYSADRMWSPFSTSGEIYEWNRGVIVIAFDGKVEKENLDGTYNHHADATIRVGNLLGANEQMIYEPFQAALNCNKYGMIILQSEGDNCFVYFPDTISVNQLSELSKVINPRQAFNFSYTHNEEIFEEQTSLDVINFATYLAKSQENQETTSTKISR